MKYSNIDSYIASFPASAQSLMTQIRDLIHELVPEVEETIRYDMPTFYLNGTYLIYFAGWKKHVSLYPFTPEMEELFPESAVYKTSGKGTIQFPLEKPFQKELIKKIIEFRIREVSAQ